MRIACSKAALVVLLTAVMSTAISLPAQAAHKATPKASAIVLSTPAKLYVSPDLTYIDVRVKYKCQNTPKVTYYLSGDVTQAAVPETYYSIGYRNVSGIVAAKCTGRKVTQTLRYQRSWWWGAPQPQPQLQPGPARFSFDLDAHAAQGVGAGWYQDADPDFEVRRTVTLVTP